MKKLYALIALPALALSSAAFAGQPSTPIQLPSQQSQQQQGVNSIRFQTMQHTEAFDRSIVDLRLGLMGTKVWDDSLRSQFDSLRQDVLNLDIILGRTDVGSDQIRQDFDIVNQDFGSIRNLLQSMSGQLGTSFNTNLNTAISAFSLLQSDINSIQ